VDSTEGIRRTVLTILFSALTAVAARVVVPFPLVPLTLQTAVVLLAGAVLGPGGGAGSQLLYLAMGLAGLPVFAGGGGLGYVLSPTFGYLLGFTGAAWLTGRLFHSLRPRSWAGNFAAMVAGLTPVYAVGLPWLWLNLRLVQGKEMPFAAVAAAGLLAPFPGDVLKAALAASVARGLVAAAHGFPGPARAGGIGRA
jgi:biotin transport system substrate-specific component